MGRKDDERCRGGDDCRDERHLCKIAKKSDIDTLKEIVRNARYVCRKCGRSAGDGANLCKPVEL